MEWQNWHNGHIKTAHYEKIIYVKTHKIQQTLNTSFQGEFHRNSEQTANKTNQHVSIVYASVLRKGERSL